MKGIVKFYNDEKGYGFITDEQGKDYYINKKINDIYHVQAGDEVSFTGKDTADQRSVVQTIESVRHADRKKEKEKEESEPSKDMENTESADHTEEPEKTNPVNLEEPNPQKNIEEISWNEEIEARSRQEAINEAVKRENGKESRFKSILKAIGEKLKKLGKSIIKPLVWAGDQVALLMMPKAARAQIYNDAIDRARDELKRQQENSLKEDAQTLLKKNEILRSEKPDAEKITELAKLAYNKKKRIIAATNKGALMFERVGNSVLIKHANPTKRTVESKKMTYGFKTIGALEYNRLGKIKAEYDLDLVLREVRMDGSFNKKEPSISDDVVLENMNNYGYDNITENPIEIQEMDDQIFKGNREEIKENLLNVINVPDQIIQDENMDKQPDSSILPIDISPDINVQFPNMYIVPDSTQYQNLAISTMEFMPEQSADFDNTANHSMDIDEIMQRNVSDTPSAEELNKEDILER